jgi:hypothetical protein
VEPDGIEYSEFTDLPRLPAGMYWKIEERWERLGIFIVQETTRVKKFCGIKFGEEVVLEHRGELHAYLDSDYEALTDESIKSVAEFLYTQLMRDLEYEKRVKDIAGFYPPKSLKATS